MEKLLRASKQESFGVVKSAISHKYDLNSTSRGW